MEGDGAGGCICCHGRRVLKILLLVCFVSILSIETVSSNVVIKASTTSAIPHHAHFEHGKMLVGNQRVHRGHHLVVVSKRRVPNGPDPIHNRHIGESRRPPGRS